jgi:hypothetical protein
MWRFNRWKPTTPAECAVLVLLFAAVFIVLGLVAIVAGLQAPAEKHDAAVGLMHIRVLAAGPRGSGGRLLLALSSAR